MDIEIKPPASLESKPHARRRPAAARRTGRRLRAVALLMAIIFSGAIGGGLIARARARHAAAPPAMAFIFFALGAAGLLFAGRIVRGTSAAAGAPEAAREGEEYKEEYEEEEEDEKYKDRLNAERRTGEAVFALTEWERRLARPVVYGALAVILLLGAWFRLHGRDWDQGQHLHPDERFLTMVVSDLRWPASVGEYLNEARSPLNPRNKAQYRTFVYGTLPTTLVRGLGEALHRTGYDQIHLLGRAVSAAFDLAGVLMLFLIARALYRDDRLALLAALLLAAAVLPIQHAHFFVTDPFAAFFITAAMAPLLRAQRRGGIANFALAGLLFGLAMACKVSVLPFASVVALVGAARAWRAWEADRRLETAMPVVWRAAAGVAVAGLVSVVAVRLAAPDIFAGPGFFGLKPSARWLASINEIRRLASGAVDLPPGHQWTNRPALWFPWKNMVLWGLGPALGLAAWAGWAAAGWRLVRRREWAHLIPAAWVGIFFLFQGTQWVKSLRYFLPIYPALILLAAWGMVKAWDWAKGVVWEARPACEHENHHRPHSIFRIGIWAFIAIVILGTLCWAVAFTAIYRRPHSRVTASRWMLAHIPAGRIIANEHWDDPLPLRVDGQDPFGGRYRGVDLHWYAEDTPAKLKEALATLDRADVIVLSSNRLYDSIARLPMRYPMTLRYYDALMGERLGFRRAAEFTSFPGLFGLSFPDQTAEEAFSVYDHPRVQIFIKTPAWDVKKAEALLTRELDWNSIVRLTPLQATRAPNALMLPEARWREMRAGGTWREIFSVRGMANRHPALIWALILELFGLIAAPYLFFAARALPDRGFALARTLGLLLAAWGVWLLASLHWAPFTRGSVAGAAAAMAAGACALAWFRRTDFLAFVKARGRLLLVEEGLFWLCFIAFLMIRRTNPDLWHPGMGGEKPMDLAYLTAVTRSLWFPPYDPWFAGGAMNYYYFGYVLAAVPMKLAGILPQFGYNLAIPTLFAMTAMGAFGAGLALAHRPGSAVGWRELKIGLLGLLFVAVIGNLGELKLLLEGCERLSKLPAGGLWPGLGPAAAWITRAIDGLVHGVLAGRAFPFRIEWWYWNATREIAHPLTEAVPITEFPFFTYLYGDLHPHAMALPLTLLALGLMLGILRGYENDYEHDYEHEHDYKRWRQEFVLLGMLGITIGALWPANAWDFPTYGALALAVLGLAQWHRFGRLSAGAVRAALGRWLAVMLVAAVTFLPFRLSYGSGYTSAELWQGSRTPLGDYLIIHGFFLFMAAGVLWTDFRFGRGHNFVVRGLRLWARRADGRARALRLARRLVRPGPFFAWAFWLPGGAVALGGLAMILGFVLPGLLIWLIAATTALLLRRRPDPRRQCLLTLIAAALSLGLMVEFVVLRGDISRMNTVFKFYLQAWVFFGLASATGVGLIGEHAARRSRAWKIAWRGGLAVLLTAVLLYPPLATWGRARDRFKSSAGRTLDGFAFANDAVYGGPKGTIQLTWEKRAIEWLRENAEGTPAIAEANTYPILYGWGNRYSIHTGLPSIIGWDWHERQQRAAVAGEMVRNRIENLRALYETTDPRQARAILRHYGARYVILGPLERATYKPAGLAKFEKTLDGFWQVVYQSEQVKILNVNEN